eukprot:CAMPEP_0117447934 /NCGR_PEP_ID=MMETSP0759-20121206/7133_1 /TAXON_ID=63605 /ORGANISM="Percolomonas cosmopolitus, Strain WS" /LENGTH=951 /DNA_ID=CAMNT_0005240289 /DNA_START=104 /DNA_END=2957 /DNA_ORIENTATION=+
MTDSDHQHSPAVDNYDTTPQQETSNSAASPPSAPIYLDNAASAPLHPKIVPHLQSYLLSSSNDTSSSLGNPSSLHFYGKQQNGILRSQKEILKRHTKAYQIAWVSGGSEANAMALLGHVGINSKYHGLDGVTQSQTNMENESNNKQKVDNDSDAPLAEVSRGESLSSPQPQTLSDSPFSLSPKKRIIVSPMEHDSISKPLRYTYHLTHGFQIDTMKVDPKTGQIDWDHFRSLLRPETVLVCQMWVSNLFGTIFDVEKMARIIKERAPYAALHIDGVQALGKLHIDMSVFQRLGVRTTVTVSGHKVHALKGIGALLFSSYETSQSFRLPLIVGGGQEGNKRAGTENVMGALSFGLAVEEAQLNIQPNQAHYKALHDHLTKRLNNSLVIVHLDLPNTYAVVPLILPGAPAEVYFNHLMEHGICTSTGSACQAKGNALPKAYLERGIEHNVCRRVLRVSFSSLTTVQEVDRLCDVLLELTDKFAPSGKVNRNYIRIVPKERKGKKSIVEPFSDAATGPSNTQSSLTETSHSSDELQTPTYTSVVVRYGELGLKGKNIKLFTYQLAKNIRAALKPIARILVHEQNRRIYVDLRNDEDSHKIPQIIDRLQDVFGISSISPVVKVKRNLSTIEHAVTWMAKQELEERSSSKRITFGVKVSVQKTAERTKEDLSSQQYQAHLGSMVNNLAPQRWKVHLKRPDVQFGVEIRTDQVYVYSKLIPGLGGLPAGVHGKALCLLSGGFDSSVAAWMMMKRGCSVHYISFWSHPYVGEKLVHKLKRLMKTLARYNAGRPKMFLIHFTKIQEAIRDQAPEPYRNILYRRAMNYVANYVTNKISAHCLTTGESLGQVASQTVKNITCIQVSARKPVFRPLIGMDKTEIIDLAKRIGTCDISAEDAPDCCTLFQPAKPITHGALEVCDQAEKGIENYLDLIHEAYKTAQILEIDEDTDLESIKVMEG